MSVAQAVMEIPAAHQLNVFGQFDCNIKKIERAFGVTFVNRGETIRLSGTEEAVGKARSVVDTLLELSRRGNTVSRMLIIRFQCLFPRKAVMYLRLIRKSSAVRSLESQ